MPYPLMRTRWFRSMLAVSLLLGVAGARRAAAQDSTAVPVPGRTTVNYLTGTSVYIAAGRLDGLREGDTVTVIRQDAPVATLRVLFLSSHQSSCARISGVEDIAVGDQIRFRPAKIAVADATSRPAYRAPRRLSGPGLHGRVGARYLSARESSGDVGFTQPSMDLRLDGLALGGTPVGLSVDLRTRKTTSDRSDGSSVVDGHTRVYQAALFWNQPGAGFRMAVGRQYLTAVTSVSLFDGGLVELGGRHVGVGLFAGTEPSPTDLGLSRDVQDVGGYVQLHSAVGSSTPWSVSTGAVGSYASNKANREFAFLQTSLSGRSISFYGLQELDYYRPWKVQQGESSMSLTSTYLSTSLRPSRWLAFNVAYDNRRSVRLYRDAVNPATSFDDAYRKGIWSGIALTGKKIRVSGDVRLSDGGSSGTATAYTGTLGFNRITPLHLNLTGRGTTYHNTNQDGTIFTGRLGGDLMTAVHLDLNAGVRNEDAPLAIPSHRQITWSGLDADVSLARAWYLSLSGQREHAPEGTTTQLYASLSWRF